MPNPLVGIGSAANDGTGDPLRTAFQKINRLPNPDNVINAGSGDYVGSAETKITAAIAAAQAAAVPIVWIPQSLQPFNANLVTFAHSSVRLVGEAAKRLVPLIDDDRRWAAKLAQLVLDIGRQRELLAAREVGDRHFEAGTLVIVGGPYGGRDRETAADRQRETEGGKR